MGLATGLHRAHWRCDAVLGKADRPVGNTASTAGCPVDGERTIRQVANDLTDIDFLPGDFKGWASQHRELLELIAEDFQASGSWPSPEPLTRRLVRRGRPTPVDDIAWRMPRPLGWVEHNPDRIVLSLFGLRCTEGALPLLEGFVRVLRTAIERYDTDDENPMITKEDVAAIAGATGANARALEEMVLREAPFFGDARGGLDDDWVRGISGGVVRYWNAGTIDDYLRQRASELRMNPQLGWPLLEARYEPPDIDPDVGVTPATTDVAGAGATAEASRVTLPSVHIEDDHRDVFISHAGEDKADVARPIAEALGSVGWSVWLDEYELTVGDRLTRSINAGLASSRFGVVVLSRAFFAKRWPQEELEGLAAKEAATGSKVILPVWHGIDEQYLADVAPMLAGRLGVSTTKGIPHVAQELIRALDRERQAPVDSERSEPVVRSIEVGERDVGQNAETTLEALRKSDSARTWLARFIGMYEGMDTGPGDPVHAVRMKAQEFLDGGPTDEDPPVIVKMIGEALPNDPRAATLEQSWTATLSPTLSSNSEEGPQRQRDDLGDLRKLLDEAAIALNQSDRIHRDIYDDLGNANKTEELKQVGRKLDEVKQRLAIRLGSEHKLTTAFSSCVELSLQVFGATTHWRLEDRDHATATAKRAMVEFETASREFIDLAARQAGVDLPGQDSGR
jgi:TIR domain